MSRRTPLTSLRKTSFSACRAWATAVAAVSALTLSFWPLGVDAHRGDHRHDCRSHRPLDRSSPIDRVTRADVAQVDRLAVAAVQAIRSPNSTLVVRKFSGWALPPRSLDLPGEPLVDLAGQHPLDDRQRGVVGVAAALDEARLQARPSAMARLIAAPPPWTSTGRMPTVSMKTMSSSRWVIARGSSITLPPSLITVTLPRNWRIRRGPRSGRRPFEWLLPTDDAPNRSEIS